MEIAGFAREVDDLHPIMNRLLAKTMELVGADAGSVALADKDTGEFSFIGVHYASLPPLEAGKIEKALRLVRLKLDEGLLGRVFRSGEPAVVPDAAADPEVRKDVADQLGYKVRNLLAVPLITEGEKLGVIEFLNKVPDGPFTDSDVGLAVSLAGQAALIVEAHRLRAGLHQSSSEELEKTLRENEEKIRGLEEDLRKTRGELESAVRRNEADLRSSRETAESLRTKTEEDAVDAAAALSESRKERESLERKISALEKDLGELRGRWLKDAEGRAVLEKELAEAREAARAGEEALHERETLRKSEEEARRAAAELSRKIEEISSAARPADGGLLDAVRALAQAVDARGPGGERLERVRRIALALAEETGIPDDRRRDLALAALLHDVGRVIVPTNTLRKSEGLTRDEAALLARAPLAASEILLPVPVLKGAAAIVGHVCERWDGRGYPDKLKGEEIPPESRIIAAAAAFEAVTSDQPGRRRLPEDVALKEIESLAGSSLDPSVVEALNRLHKKDKLKDLIH